MTRQRNKTIKEYSSISDEQLAKKLSEDFKKNPSEFSQASSSGIYDSNSFLKNTSARTIAPILKWL